MSASISWLVSVLICTYNASQTIKKTLQSCLDQTYSKIEILIHDDQSWDCTLDIIYSIQDPRIKIITSWTKLGPYKWLNFLLDHARWEYIAIQDHDDLWHPEKLMKQITFLENREWKRYLGCGTKTLMRYESDQQWFEYFLWKENYYTIHPSLVFRNTDMRYPEDTNYMVDAYFQKKLCGGQRLIYNIQEILTLHLIKSWASNHSYTWFTYSRATIRSLFYLHPIWYGVCILWWETLRKALYPVFHWVGKGNWIDVAERVPFRLMGYRMNEYSKERLREMEF